MIAIHYCTEFILIAIKVRHANLKNLIPENFKILINEININLIVLKFICYDRQHLET